MIAVVDYGVNNLRSVVRALEAGGHRSALTTDPAEVRAADRVLVPGVGNFGQGSRNLASSGLGEAVREAAAAPEDVDVHQGHPDRGHGLHRAKASSSSMPARWDFSGWNWAPITVSWPTRVGNTASYSPVPSTAPEGRSLGW